MPDFSWFDSLHAMSREFGTSSRSLRALNTEKATDSDNIMIIVLKTCAPELAAPLAKLFQYSYNAHVYPTMWGIAKYVWSKESRTNPTQPVIARDNK
eukprot:g41317.t1